MLFVMTIIFIGLATLLLLVILMQLWRRYAINHTSSTSLHSRDNPLILRILAPLSIYLDPWVTWRYRSYLSRKLKLIELDNWRAVDLFGLQTVLTIIFFFFFALCLNVWGFDIVWPNARNIAFLIFAGCVVIVICSFWLPILWINLRHNRVCMSIKSVFPSYLDLLVIAHRSGLSMTASFQFCTQALPSGLLKKWCGLVLSDVAQGRALGESLIFRSKNIDLDDLISFARTVVQTESLGTSLAQQLSNQADQLRLERNLRLETLSAKAPIKMLLPLALFIFPCNFFILGFPIVATILQLD